MAEEGRTYSMAEWLRQATVTEKVLFLSALVTFVVAVCIALVELGGKL